MSSPSQAQPLVTGGPCHLHSFSAQDVSTSRCAARDHGALRVSYGHGALRVLPVMARSAPRRPEISGYRDQVFTPWGNVVLMVLAAVLIVAAALDARRRRRRGQQAWTPGHKIGVFAMSLVLLGQVLVLV